MSKVLIIPDVHGRPFWRKAKEKIKKEVSEIEKRTDLTKEEKVEKICIVFGTFCGALAVQPIPFADFFE